MIGLEREFLVANVGSPDKFVVVPDGFPADECGLLAEARGQPFTSVEEAVFSLQADTYRLTKQFEAKGLVLVDLPIGKIDKAVRLQAARHYDKGRTQYQNLYGYEAYRNAMNEQTAGIHVSFTCPVTVCYDKAEDDKSPEPNIFRYSEADCHVYGPPHSQQEAKRYISPNSYNGIRALTPMFAYNDSEHDMTHQYYADALLMDEYQGTRAYCKLDSSCT